MSSKECTVCFDSDSNVHLFYFACSEHGICQECLITQIKVATHDERYYPLRCAGGDGVCIPDEAIFRVFGFGDADLEEILDNFYEKIEEYQLPAAARTYCANQTCHLTLGYSRFLQPAESNDSTCLECPECEENTCRLCRNARPADEAHICESDDLDTQVRAFVETVPEDDRWLWQKCFSCGSWVEKSEACNHMSCLCGSEFCLCCGRGWAGLVSCKWGCPKYEKPVYDSEGYNQNGYDPATGLDREGLPWDPNHEHEGDFEDEEEEEWPLGPPEIGVGGYDQYGIDADGVDQDGYDRDGFDADGWDRDGFNEFGRDREGYDMSGFDDSGLDRDGFDDEGYNRYGVTRDGYGYDGYNAAGFDRRGLNRAGRDAHGYFEDGFDLDGFDREGMSLRNMPREWYDEEGFDPFGEDVYGYSRAGYDFEGRDPYGYNIDGYDNDGYDERGFGRDGFSRWGVDKYGRDREGYKYNGYDCHHRDRNGNIHPDYHEANDGNIRRIGDEGPSATVMECTHRMGFVRASAVCYVCHWRSDIFHHRCADCQAAICRACHFRSAEYQRSEVRRQYPFPGADSFGIEEMFSRQGRTTTSPEEGQLGGSHGEEETAHKHAKAW